MKLLQVFAALIVFVVATQASELEFRLDDYRGHLPFELTRRSPDTNAEIGDNVGSPLILTSYITDGNTEEGRLLASVNSSVLGVDVESYSGYFTVDSSTSSNMFFWYFPASEADEDEAPVLVYLQGGPGATSLLGLFNENGPFSVNSSGQIVLREYSWNKLFNVIYIDNPVGTGFSFTRRQKGYSTNEEEIAVNLYSTITQFFDLFTYLQDNDFYIVGESYAGKYVPSVAYKIRQASENNFNLKGIAVGDGLTDPASMLNYGEFLMNAGVIDDLQAKQLERQSNEIYNYILQEKWLEGFRIWTTMLVEYEDWTGLTDQYNYLYAADPISDYYMTYVESPDIREAIHVGRTKFELQSYDVYIHLFADMLKSVKPKLENLLTQEDLKILYYSGQVDIIIGHTETQNLIRNLFWDRAEEYYESDKIIWRIGDDLAGYVKGAGNFTYVIVRGAGHMVPFDQPARAWDMIRRFVQDESFSDES